MGTAARLLLSTTLACEMLRAVKESAAGKNCPHPSQDRDPHVKVHSTGGWLRVGGMAEVMRGLQSEPHIPKEQ